MGDVDESCIYRVRASDAGVIQINLAEAAEFDCSEMSLYMVTDNNVEGPFFNEGRHRRGGYGYDSSYGSGASYDNSNHEVDLVYTNNGGMKFNFNFHFDFELLPGLPGGAVQQGYKETAGDYYKPSYNNNNNNNDNDEDSLLRSQGGRVAEVAWSCRLLRNTSCARWRGRTHRTPAWRSTSAGRRRGKPPCPC